MEKIKVILCNVVNQKGNDFFFRTTLASMIKGCGNGKLSIQLGNQSNKMIKNGQDFDWKQIK